MENLINHAIKMVCESDMKESSKNEVIDLLNTLIKTKKENMNFAITVLAEIAERAKQEDAPIYEGDKEVDNWVRLSDVNEIINNNLN